MTTTLVAKEAVNSTIGTFFVCKMQWYMFLRPSSIVYSFGLCRWCCRGYQTCTEFGFYQTCEVGSDCFYTQGLDLLADEDGFCQVLYNISETQIQSNIDASNAFYGGRKPNATRILYPNGEVDPWKSQGVLESPGPELPVMLVKGASHHAWTHPSLPTDQATVVQARLDIKKQVAEWLKEE